MNEQDRPCYTCGWPGPHQWAERDMALEALADPSQWLWTPGVCGQCRRAIRTTPMIDAIATDVTPKA